MELSEKYKIELINLQKAVSSFESALNASFENLDSVTSNMKVKHIFFLRHARTDL
jgi:hypothetical protein